MNSLVVIAFLDIEPLGAFEIVFFTIMIHMRLDLSHPPISLLSLEVLSFVRGEGKSNFNARSRLMTAKTIKKSHISLKAKINLNKGKPYLKIPGIPLIFHFWTKNINL